MNVFDSKRLARTQDKDLVFETLLVKNPRSGFFQQMTDVYMFALALGVKRKKRSRLVGTQGNAISMGYFTDEQKKFFDMVVLYSEAGDLDSLDKSNPDTVEQMKRTIEEYANGGLEIILEKIRSHPENAFNVVQLMIDHELKADLPEDIDQDLEW